MSFYWMNLSFDFNSNMGGKSEWEIVRKIIQME